MKSKEKQSKAEVDEGNSMNNQEKEENKLQGASFRSWVPDETQAWLNGTVSRDKHKTNMQNILKLTKLEEALLEDSLASSTLLSMRKSGLRHFTLRWSKAHYQGFRV
ncbi:hypothetical protein HPP92_007930 [Vanilla planifolia]|uniref:Uncharacterized protein n=1 Tax=Vanilla planifolia TaxID=51239 RepID=A0A835RHK1_VANPL|nr:hypothetical protein HPP92_007930 [Vanilla planifolia]